MKNYEINIRGNAEYCGETWNMYLKKHHVCFCLQQRVNYDLPDLQLMVLLQFKRKWLTWVYYLGGTWSLLVSFFFFHLTRVTIVIFRAAWRLWERMARTFWPCAQEISQNQLDISGAVSTQVSFVESFCIYYFLLLFIVHSFYFSEESLHDSGKRRRVWCDQ